MNGWKNPYAQDVRQQVRVRLPGRLDGVAQRLAEEILAGRRLDGDKCPSMLRLKLATEPRLIELLGGQDRRFNFLAHHVCPPEVAPPESLLRPEAPPTLYHLHCEPPQGVGRDAADGVVNQ